MEKKVRQQLQLHEVTFHNCSHAWCVDAQTLSRVEGIYGAPQHGSGVFHRLRCESDL